METKIFNPELPEMHLACLNDDMRFNMRLIRVENGTAYCTNGSMVAVADLNLASNLTADAISVLNGKCLHMDTWKEMCKSDVIDFTEESIMISINGVDKALFYANTQGEFFNIKSLIQDAKDVGSEKIDLVHFNPKFIQIASKIFHGDNVSISFSAGNKGHILFPNSYEGMFCLVMPKMQNEGESPRYIFTW